MGIIKPHPEAKQGFWPEQELEWISLYHLVAVSRQNTLTNNLAERGMWEEFRGACKVLNIFKSLCANYADSKCRPKEQNKAEYGR